jgi:hypothetical protein
MEKKVFFISYQNIILLISSAVLKKKKNPPQSKVDYKPLPLNSPEPTEKPVVKPEPAEKSVVKPEPNKTPLEEPAKEITVFHKNLDDNLPKNFKPSTLPQVSGDNNINKLMEMGLEFLCYLLE